ncbi:MAG: hypothetical protein HY342_03155 [Candidatus Lambdaproteobacteria bacterium]|nr:hypothetical protein [Candidatus Lambdaproteobacteria bacterium]
MPEHPTPPPALTLPALQAYVREMVRARGFTTELNEIFILLTEEVGELAREFKHEAFYPERHDAQNLGFELVDILLYLLDLANGFGVDLMTLWPRHEQDNDRRFGVAVRDAPAVQPGFTLNALVAHAEAKRRQRGFADTDERLLILLMEELGEIARELRRHWRGRAAPERMGAEIIDALSYLLRLAHGRGVDLETALRGKEARNAQRTWDF